MVVLAVLGNIIQAFEDPPVGTEALMWLLFNEFTAPATGKYIIQVYSYNNDGAAGWGVYKLTISDVTDD